MHHDDVCSIWFSYTNITSSTLYIYTPRQLYGSKNMLKIFVNKNDQIKNTHDWTGLKATWMFNINYQNVYMVGPIQVSGSVCAKYKKCTEHMYLFSFYIEWCKCLARPHVALVDDLICLAIYSWDGRSICVLQLCGCEQARLWLKYNWVSTEYIHIYATSFYEGKF